MAMARTKDRIVLADDHQLVLDGVHALLESGGFEVVGKAKNGEEVMELTKALSPDLVLLDVHMPGANGVDVGRQLKKEFQGIKVIILTMHNSQSLMQQVKGAGLDGFLVKNTSGRELLGALRKVADGGQWFPALEGSNGAAELDRASLLTTREREVLMHIAKGLTSAQIEAALFISLRTVETHRKNINQKLGTHMISDLVMVAQRLGLANSSRARPTGSSSTLGPIAFA